MLIVDVDTAAAQAFLDGISDRLRDGRTLLEFLAGEIRDYESTVFATQGRGTWAPLDQVTVAEKGSARVLVDTGELLRDLTQYGAGIQRIDGETVEVGTEHPGANFLKTGVRGMPKRDPAPEPPAATVRQWGQSLLDVIVHGRPL